MSNPQQKQLTASGLLLCIALVGCTPTTNSSPPALRLTTQSELIEAYRLAFESGDKDTIFSLVKWDGSTGELRELQENMLTSWIGKHKITRIELILFEDDPESTREFDGREVELNLKATHWLVVENTGNEGYKGGQSTGSLKWPVGIENGFYRMCGTCYSAVQGKSL